MSEQRIGTLLFWSKKGYGIISVPIKGSRNVERYYLSQIRILRGPAGLRAGMKVQFQVASAVPNPGQLPVACNAVFIEDDSNYDIVEPAAAPLADLLSGSKAVQS
jgi:hypothetical protein